MVKYVLPSIDLKVSLTSYMTVENTEFHEAQSAK